MAKEIETEVMPIESAVTTKEVVVGALDVATQRINEHFTHDGKKWTLNSKAVPTIEEGYQIVKDVIGFKQAGEWIGNESSWLLGNLVSELRRVYGEDFDVDSLEGVTHRTHVTLRTAESVFCGFQDCRVPGLSYTHHHEVFFVKGLSDKKKMMVLLKAKEMKLSTTYTRTLAKLVAREKDGEPSVLTNGDTALALMNKLDVKKKTEPVFILVSYDGRVRKVKEHALTEDMDKGSQIIIMIHPEMELLRLSKARIPNI
jgi:hypothetical protein